MSALDRSVFGWSRSPVIPRDVLDALDDDQADAALAVLVRRRRAALVSLIAEVAAYHRTGSNTLLTDEAYAEVIKGETRRYLPLAHAIVDALAASATKPCPTCGGTGNDGLLPYPGCSPCGGTGRVADATKEDDRG